MQVVIRAYLNSRFEGGVEHDKSGEAVEAILPVHLLPVETTHYLPTSKKCSVSSACFSLRRTFSSSAGLNSFTVPGS